jgi:hypothetical protein
LGHRSKEGSTKAESFADDEMDLERLRECLPGRPEATVSTFRKIVVQEDVLPREAEEEDGWEKVNTKNLRPKSLKKVYKKLDLFRKRTTVTTRSEVESDIFDFKEEESAEVDEMVKRYSQRLAGQRDIGRFIESLSPTKQRFTVRVK